MLGISSFGVSGLKRESTWSIRPSGNKLRGSSFGDQAGGIKLRGESGLKGIRLAGIRLGEIKMREDEA